MTNSKKILYALVTTGMFCVFFSTQDLRAQTTSTPYSMFGIGEIDSGNYGENSGMGGIGIGFRQINLLNPLNPAANASLMPKTFIFDGSFYGKQAFYRGQGKTAHTGNGNIQRLAIGFRAARPWVITAGILPFSSVGYDIRTSSPVEGSEMETFETSFTGSGGLNKVFIGQSLSITPKLSVGVNASLIFGRITHAEHTPYWNIQKRSRGEKVHFDFGLQYTDMLSSDTRMTVGLVGSYGTDIKMYNSRLSYDYEGNVAVNDVLSSTQDHIPAFYGAGVSFNHRNKIAFGLDYRFQQWSKAEISSATIRYKDMHKLSAGFSIIPNIYNARNYLQLIKYQVGFMVNDSYLDVSGKNATNYAATAGMVFPMRNNNSLHLGLEYGKNGGFTGGRNAIREDYFKVTVGFSFSEAWFVRFKYN